MINSFICMTLVRIGRPLSVPPVGWAACFLKMNWLCFVSRIVWNMWWWLPFLPMRQRAISVSTSFCTMEFTGKCGRSILCWWGIIVTGMRRLWGLFCCKEKYADFVDQVSGVTLLGNISYFFYADILLFFNGIWSSVMLYREYPEKSFKSFSLLANALPVGIPAEGLGSGILQLGLECFSRADILPIFGESFFWRIFSGWNISQCISFSRNADGQGVCGMAERSERKVRRFGM